ncbi:PP2C family protein-serine/threonine phosphatase [Pontivivens insulae]|uniref:Regulator of RpoS n=1 Tax=Pontivivens insulae TaxID=1639689 RepID=A0A2R8A6R4_9RHOB|nr:SpoIIE family protein phosphatase [Pontivivens insulae]RED18037.1 sigma-B regulation protein RsbU (phosphoserine phosphatase) [Pontivivens insulae]SPF27933.1 Regulator of RpoS [Pontivivens insulae]
MLDAAEALKIVVVEDDYFQRTYAVSLLRKLGHIALEAEDGATALEVLRESGAKIVICDLDMPGMDGHTLVRHVRDEWRGEDESYVHILMVTASSQTADREIALEAGVDDFMLKPLELPILSARIASVARMIRHERLLEQRKRGLEEANTRILRDLEAASRAQRRLLPDVGRDIGGLRFHSEFVPSQILSGDMFGFFELPNGMVAFYAIDVAGHGVRASLKSVALGHLLTAAYFNSYAFAEDGSPDPARLVERLNERFFEDGHEEYFTMFCGIFDGATGRVSVCNAGYQPPWIARVRDGVSLLDLGGFPVALLGSATFETEHLTLDPGDLLVLCSDGATEADDLAGQAFGEPRVQQVVETCKDRPKMIPAHLLDVLDRWRDGRALDDDLTILICERTQPT